MNIVELMLMAYCSLGVVVLIIVAIDEPKYTWVEVNRYHIKMAAMQRAVDGFMRVLGERLSPAFRDAALSFNEASKALEKFGEASRNDRLP